MISTGLRVRGVEWMGHPHVPVPRHSPPVLELPHCQVSVTFALSKLVTPLLSEPEKRQQF